LTLVEAAVETLESSLAAEGAGADRIELCENLREGGTTPDGALVATIVERIRLPVFVLIRPRSGDFVYSANEFDVMIRDIELTRTMGIAGIVTGALDTNRRVDVKRTRSLVKAASGLPVTFHRAIDSSANLAVALEDAIEGGVSRVLTSGGALTATQGVDVIAALVLQARERVSIVAGGGIRDHNARELIARTGVHEVHGRLVNEAQMRGLVDAVKRTR
jgi:copper homeostasis protein